jgi:2-polyprenyl-6-methoxyphenol hydroxylase-like FAD-dependent oxidoreductase
MCAARALADHFERVTIVDRDTYPDGPRARRGVPQARHVHALLIRGRRELEALFPGFERGMLDAGAPDIDFAETFAIFRANGWAARGNIGSTLWSSRDLLESIVRRLLRRIDNVELVEDTPVEGLVVEDGRVTGARVRRNGGDAIGADLVVDASGRASPVVRWLDEHGIAPPPAEIVDADVGYASRWYRRAEPDRIPRDWSWKGVWIDGEPPDRSPGGVAFPTENGGFQVTLVGFGGDHPPGDEHGFMDYARTLRSPLLADLMDRLEPTSPVYRQTKLVNRYRRYDKWKADLPGFIATGDSVCGFNPVYGQGMSTAAACGAILRDVLERRGDDPKLHKRFHKAQAKFLELPWSMATGADFFWSCTTGHKRFGTDAVNAYFLRVFHTMTGDPELLSRLGPIFHLIQSPSRMFAPWVVARVLRKTGWRRRQRELMENGIDCTRPPWE